MATAIVPWPVCALARLRAVAPANPGFLLTVAAPPPLPRCWSFVRQGALRHLCARAPREGRACGLTARWMWGIPRHSNRVAATGEIRNGAAPAAKAKGHGGVRSTSPVIWIWKPRALWTSPNTTAPFLWRSPCLQLAIGPGGRHQSESGATRDLGGCGPRLAYHAVGLSEDLDTGRVGGAQ